jgi:hypothetical protein
VKEIKGGMGGDFLVRLKETKLQTKMKRRKKKKIEQRMIRKCVPRKISN